MTTPNGPSSSGSEERSDIDEKAALDDRAAKFAQGAPPIPRNAVVIAVVAFAILGMGGILFDHFFGGSTSTSSAITAGTNPPGLSTTTLAPVTRRTVPSGPGSGQLPASIPALLGLTKLNAAPAPQFALITTRGVSISLKDLRGRVVVLSFFDSRCNDICPVLAAELRLSIADLGSDASHVVFLGVNTDPLATSLESASAADAAAGLGALKQWHFLTGSLEQLDSVWTAYGVAIQAQKLTGLVSHNNVLYFIDGKGRMRLRATPFANEGGSGAFSLPRTTETLFASGIAYSVKSLLETPAAQLQGSWTPVP